LRMPHTNVYKVFWIEATSLSLSFAVILRLILEAYITVFLFNNVV
jgi:hypothetical protein